MEIEIRRLSAYKDVTIKSGDTTISLGLHNTSECLALAKIFKEAIWDLLYDDKEQYNQLMEKE